jgi:hypothetical protein
VEALIDQLTEVDAQTAGIHSTAWFRGFIGVENPPAMVGGVFGSDAPKTFPQMQELVRRGISAVPALIEHLDDKRPTKLTVGGDFPSGGFFMFAYFDVEYDPKIPSQRTTASSSRSSIDPRYQVPDLKYTVCVGDICYLLIGQIVNRELLPVRYQPSAGFVVNSPAREPSLVRLVTRDWSNIDKSRHLASLIADLQGDDDYSAASALLRLRFYYPEEYHRQSAGALKTRIEAIEQNPGAR